MLIGKASKSALRLAEGRPESPFCGFMQPKSGPEARFPARKHYCITYGSEIQKLNCPACPGLGHTQVPGIPGPPNYTLPDPPSYKGYWSKNTRATPPTEFFKRFGRSGHGIVWFSLPAGFWAGDRRFWERAPNRFKTHPNTNGGALCAPPFLDGC